MSEEAKAPEAKPGWGDRIGPKKISHRHDFIIHLAALGLSNKEIKQRVHMTDGRLSIILSNTRIRAEVARVRKEIFNEDLDQNLRTMLPKSVETLREILESPGERSSLRADVAFRIMDRTHGKPKQQIEHTGTLIKDLFEQLDEKFQGAHPVLSTLSAPDSIDEWAEANLGEKKSSE